LLDANRGKFDAQYALPPKRSIFLINQNATTNLPSTRHIHPTHGEIQHITHLLHEILPSDISRMSGSSHIQGAAILAMSKIVDGHRVMGQSERLQKEHGPRLRLEEQAKTREDKFPRVRHIPCKEFTQTQFKPERKFIKGQKKGLGNRSKEYLG
jgi:hypothetical protein